MSASGDWAARAASSRSSSRSSPGAARSRPAPRLDELGIAHGGVQDAGYGSGLSFRDPDGLPLELVAPPA